MLRSFRLGLFMIGASLMVSCGGGGVTPDDTGTGGFSFGGGIGNGGDMGSGGDNGNTGGMFASGGRDGTGGGSGGTMTVGSGGVSPSGGSGGAIGGSGGVAIDGGSGGVETLPDSGAPDASGEVDGSSAGGTGGEGGTAGAGGSDLGGAGSGGTGALDAGTAVCGNGDAEGQEVCDTGGDSKSCDSDCTLVKCGDRHVNVAAGEQCDDGNAKGGDGCDKNCQIENQCSTPTPIVLSQTGSALTGTINRTTSDAISEIHDAPCKGAEVGQGPDGIFSFTIERTRSVTVTLSASFDGLLRAYTKPCAPSAGLVDLSGAACANEGSGKESMTFPDLSAGTYYVAVDGVAAGDKGSYTLDVNAECNGVNQVRLVELGIGSTDYTVLRNMSDCPANLAGTKILFDDSVATDLTTALPSVKLAPGEQLRVQENLGASVPGAIDAGGSIPFQPDRGGSVLFCAGDCSVGGSVIDVVSFADGDPNPPIQPPPALPAGVTFSFPLTGIDAGSQDTKSWVRVASTTSSFTGGDWCEGTPNVPFGLRLSEVFVGDPDYFAITNHADCAINLQGFGARAATEGVTTNVDKSFASRFLGAGATVYVSEAPGPSDIGIGAIANTGALAGDVQLCFGSCDTAGGLIDVVAWDGSSSVFPALPSPVTFTPAGLSSVTLANQGANSYLRQGVTGNNPRFSAADWKIGSKSR